MLALLTQMNLFKWMSHLERWHHMISVIFRAVIKPLRKITAIWLLPGILHVRQAYYLQSIGTFPKVCMNEGKSGERVRIYKCCEKAKILI